MLAMLPSTVRRLLVDMRAYQSRGRLQDRGRQVARARTSSLSSAPLQVTCRRLELKREPPLELLLVDLAGG